MKTINKFFAIAAIAAASMFSVQTASAAVQTVNATAGTQTETLLNLKFADYYGSGWEDVDKVISDNPNRDQIVMCGVVLRDGLKKGTLSDEEVFNLMNKMSEYGCSGEFIIWISCHE